MLLSTHPQKFGLFLGRACSFKVTLRGAAVLGRSPPPPFFKAQVWLKQGLLEEVDELGEEFQSFWGQIWNRDRADTTWEDQEWDQARTLVAECGEAWPQTQVDWNDLDMWRAVLRQLPSGKARGVDGWSYEELRQLPDGAIEHLGQLMQLADGSFPQPAMQARTVLLPKQAQTEGMSGTRPITILGCLNRLWSRYVTAWIVPRWSQAFPEGIACGLQQGGRGAQSRGNDDD